MIVRFDLESDGDAVADIDNAGILARPLQHVCAFRWQFFQVNARALVGTVFAPHDAEDTKLG